MIYRALEVVQIFLAGGRADGWTEVFQEVLADLKSGIFLKGGGESC